MSITQPQVRPVARPVAKTKTLHFLRPQKEQGFLGVIMQGFLGVIMQGFLGVIMQGFLDVIEIFIFSYQPFF